MSVARKSLLIAVAAVSVIFYIGFFAHNQPKDCKTTERSFNTKSFDVALCFLNRSDVGISYMAMHVYEGGYLIAERKFRRYTDSGERMFNELEYQESGIIYTDADPERKLPPSKNYLSMPPTKWDWFTANYWPF